MKTDIQNNIATILAKGETIRSAEDILELFGECFGCDIVGFVLFEENITPLFFDPKTGVAGEILQKFSNYRLKVAIVGDFTKYESVALANFIRECNRGNSVRFVASYDAAIKWFNIVNSK